MHLEFFKGEPTILNMLGQKVDFELKSKYDTNTFWDQKGASCF